MRTIPSAMLIALLCASCSGTPPLVHEAVPVTLDVPAHLDKPTPEPKVDVAATRSKADLMIVLGDVLTWGRTVYAEFFELRRLIEVRNGQATGAIVAAKPTAPAGGPR